MPSGPSRLVNVSCVRVSALVGCCFVPELPSILEMPFCFLEPHPIEALLALDVFQRHPGLECSYIALEEHPLSALQDGRPVDRDFVQSHFSACSQKSLIVALDS